MNDHSELQRLAEAFPADLDWDSNTEPFFNGPSGESLGGGSTGFYSVYGQPFEIDGDTYDGNEYVPVCTKDFAKFVCSAREGVLALIAENERLSELSEHLVQLRETHGFDSWSAALVEVDKLRAEKEALRSKLTTVHFVCDQLPGPDGCRFIELEGSQGQSLGDESGKWEIRPDGLVQLVVEIASPDVKHMAALLECAQGDLKQAMKVIDSYGASGFGDAFYQVAERLGITGARPVSPMQVFNSEVLPALDKAIKDAERYQWLCDKFGETKLPCAIERILAGDMYVADGKTSIDAAIDAAMSKEG